MCLVLRNTTRRGRPADARTTRRMWRCRFARPSTRSVTPTVVFSSGNRRLLRAGLPDLLADNLARVPDPLALIGVGRAEGAEAGGRLADEVFVHAAERDRGLLVDLGRHPVRQREHDRVRVAQGKRE